MPRMKIQSEYDDLDKYINHFQTIIYYKKDTYIKHNPYGPTIISKYGHIEYWLNNNRHRLDGAAIIYSDGEERYWINNEWLTKEEFETHPERLKYLNKEYLISLI